jgi:hypothetical protein
LVEAQWPLFLIGGLLPFTRAPYLIGLLSKNLIRAARSYCGKKGLARADCIEVARNKRSTYGPDTEAQDLSPPDLHFRLATRGQSIQKGQ